MKKFTLLQNMPELALTIGMFASAHAASFTVNVVDKEGKPAMDAVVILQPDGKGLPKIPLVANAVIAQEKMQFIPAVSIVPLGAKVRFVNNDPWDHHVRASAAGAAQFAIASSGTGVATKGFELRLEGKQDGKPGKFADITMDKVGAQSAVLLGCFIHGSMRGFVYVSESPWAAKTGADGNAVFDDVPEGKVQIKVWQADQLVDVPVQTSAVGASPVKITVQLPVTPRRRRI